MILNYTGRLGGKEAALGWLIVLVIGVGIYSNTWQSPFVLDDIHSIVQNDARRKVDWSPANLLGTRAMAYLTLDLNYAWGGLAVEGYHAVNIFLHLINTGLVTTLLYFVTRRVYRPVVWRMTYIKIENYWLLAFTGGLLFLTHPIQTQSVNYIVQRMVLLTTLFYVAALVFYWLYRASGHKVRAMGWAVMSLGSSILAMHTKEIAITLPVVVVLIEYLFWARSWRRLIKRWWRLLPWVLTIAIIPAYLLEVRDVFIHGAEVPPYAYNDTVFDKLSLGRINNVSAETKDISRQVYFVTEWRVIVKYLRLIIWPVGLNIDHDVPWQDEVFGAASLSSLAIIIGVIGAGLALLIKGRVVGAGGIGIFFLALSVESSIIPIKDNIFEHRLYLAMVGVALVVIEGLAWVLARAKAAEGEGRDWLAKILVGLVCLIVVLSGLSYHRNGTWRSALSLWSDAAAKSPHKARPLNNLGLAYEELGRLDEAERVYRQALADNTDHIEVMINLGALLGKTKRADEALAILKRAIEIKPEVVSGYVNVGNVYLLKKDYLEAERMYRRAVELKRDNYNAWASLGDALIGQGESRAAIEAYEKATAIDQTEAEWFNRLGALYAMAARYEDAAKALERALVIDPQLEVARNNLNKLKRERVAR